MNITSIERIQNKFLWDRFINHKHQLRAKLGRESDVKLLWHGARGVDSHQISDNEQGFDNRFSRNGAHGYGNYFAINANYSVPSYCFNEPDGSVGVFLVKLMIGNTISGVNQKG